MFILFIIILFFKTKKISTTFKHNACGGGRVLYKIITNIKITTVKYIYYLLFIQFPIGKNQIWIFFLISICTIPFCLEHWWPTRSQQWKVLLPSTFLKYLQKKIIFSAIEYSGMPAQRGNCIINNVIARKVIILI